MLRDLFRNPAFVLITFGFLPGGLFVIGVMMSRTLADPWWSLGFALAALALFILGTALAALTERP